MHDDRWPGPTAIVDINVHDQEGSIINRTTRSNTQHTEIPIRDAVKTSNETKNSDYLALAIRATPRGGPLLLAAWIAVSTSDTQPARSLLTFCLS